MAWHATATATTGAKRYGGGKRSKRLLRSAVLFALGTAETGYIFGDEGRKKVGGENYVGRQVS